MATDVARLSFDPARHFRGVVPQQGRVSLEAEANEQRVIDSEEQRAQIIDIVGPVGTPDDGYAVSQGAGPGLTIGAGTMYVGGWRVELDADLSDADQPDWLDRTPTKREGGREHVVLLVREADVTAVEDPALYEVALGGPDGAARTRLLQRILRLPTEGDTCAEAIAQDGLGWTQQGLVHDPETAALLSQSRLQVTWEGDPQPANPCEPTSTGGYLGAENQLIRVQLTRVGADGRFDLVWGYDDASFLYRVTADASTNPVLTLDRTPVDDHHRPRAGQVVQALRSTAALHGTDGAVEGYVAALGGVIGVLGAPYDPDTRTVQFPAPLPTAYLDADRTPQLYLRIWEEQITNAEAGVPIRLTGTGLQVTITAVGGRLHLDDHWCIGVRPATPTAVYPARYLRAPQPPDGPRQWVCPLAVIEWRERELDIRQDCRRGFQPLTELDQDGCCTIQVTPSDAAAGTLQARIDRAVASRQVSERGDRVLVCFAPGRYVLSRPLVLTKRHSNLTLRSCDASAVLAVRPGRAEAFGHGLIIAVDADNLTLSGLEFELPQVPATLARVAGTTGGVFDRDAVRAINADQANRYVSIGVRAVNCAVLAVTGCLFRFTLGEHQTTRADAQTMPRNVFGVGVFAAGGAWGFQLTGNRFLHDPTVPVAEDGPFHLLVGYLLTQTALGRTGRGAEARRLGASRLPGLIDDALIADNEFRGLTAGVVVAAGLGDIRVWDNVITHCFGGVWLLDASTLLGTSASESMVAAMPGAVAAALVSLVGNAVLLRILVLAMLYPLPDAADGPPRGASAASAEAIGRLREASLLRDRTVAETLLARVAAERGGAAERAGVAEHGGAAERGGAAPETMSLRAAPLLSRNLAAAWDGLVTLNRLDERPTELPCAIVVQRNTVDCTTPEESVTGPALLIGATVSAGNRPTVTVAGNRLVSLRSQVVAAVVGGSGATLTGNIVAGQRSAALAVVGVLAAAITGNVISGKVVLPANRPFPPPLDTWLPFNEIFV